MKLDEALRIALEFENKVRDHYQSGAKKIADAKGRRAFEALAREEQGHVDFLQNSLAEWQASGRVKAKKLATRLPTPAWVKKAMAEHKQMSMKRVAEKNEIDLLKTAVQLEIEASGFYKGLIAKLASQDQPLFAQFMTIEEGHVAIVQAELDAVQGNGFWFDVMEFSLEAG